MPQRAHRMMERDADEDRPRQRPIEEDRSQLAQRVGRIDDVPVVVIQEPAAGQELPQAEDERPAHRPDRDEGGEPFAVHHREVDADGADRVERLGLDEETREQEQRRGHRAPDGRPPDERRQGGNDERQRQEVGPHRPREVGDLDEEEEDGGRRERGPPITLGSRDPVETQEDPEKRCEAHRATGREAEAEDLSQRCNHCGIGGRVGQIGAGKDMHVTVQRRAREHEACGLEDPALCPLHGVRRADECKCEREPERRDSSHRGAHE